MGRTYIQWEVAAVLASVRGEGDREALLKQAMAPGEKSDVLKRYFARVRKYVAQGVLKCEVHPRYRMREFDADEIDVWAESYYKTAKQGVPITRHRSKTAIDRSEDTKSMKAARDLMEQEMRARKKASRNKVLGE